MVAFKNRQFGAVTTFNGYKSIKQRNAKLMIRQLKHGVNTFYASIKPNTMPI